MMALQRKRLTGEDSKTLDLVALALPQTFKAPPGPKDLLTHGVHAGGLVLRKPLAAAHAEVSKALFPHDVRRVQVAAVEDDRLLELVPQLFEVGRTELRPLGHNHQGIRAVHRLVGIGGVLDSLAIAEQRPAALHGHRIVRAYPGALRQQEFDKHQAGRLAHVIGAGFERQAPQGDQAAGQRFSEVGLDLPPQPCLLRIVDTRYGLDEPRSIAVFARGLRQCGGILRQTGASVTAACVQVVVADALVRADCAAHLLDIGADALGQSGQLVHEADARGQHGVGCVLGQFRRGAIHDHEAIVLAVKRCVQAA